MLWFGGSPKCCGLPSHHTVKHSQMRKSKKLQNKRDFLSPAGKPAQRVGTKTLACGGLQDRTYDTLGKRSPFESGEAQVSNLDRSSGAGNEDVVTFEVAVDDGRRPGMKEVQPLQNLSAPTAQDFDLHLFKPLQISARHSKQCIEPSNV